MARTSDFEYHLPKHFVAQEPLLEREKARLLVLDRTSGDIRHLQFTDLTGYLHEGDVLVLNNTRVVPARFQGKREATGGKVEVLLIEPAREDLRGKWAAEGFDPSAIWLAYTRSGGKLIPGERLSIPDAGIAFTLLERLGEEGDIVASQLQRGGDIREAMERFGHTPLPPYIDRGKDCTDTPLDREYYQTVYADKPGAVAAPTAGMHFTPRMLEEIAGLGVEIVYLTLHIGPGTFRPVKSESVEEHRMHSERYEVPPEAFQAVLAARERGSSVVAVGTTVVRTLETIAVQGLKKPCLSGRTDIFIRPPWRFRLVDALVTNFHLPRSTLLMLVSAFAGREKILEVYEEAKRENYRFFSYGDAMLII